MNGEVVGEATIEKEGLYYHISCVCNLPTDKIYRVFAITPSEEVNLGVCRPENTQMCLETKVSARRIGDTAPEFYIIPKCENTYEFYEVVSEQPFADIMILRECRFAVKGGKLGVIREIHP